MMIVYRVGARFVKIQRRNALIVVKQMIHVHVCEISVFVVANLLVTSHLRFVMIVGKKNITSIKDGMKEYGVETYQMMIPLIQSNLSS